MSTTAKTQPDALSRVYAAALFESAEAAGGQDAIEATLSELEEILELARENPTFGEFLSSQILGAKERSASIGAIFTGRASDHVVRFLQVLNDKGRLGHLGAVVSAFDELVQKRFGRVEVDVFTATPTQEGDLESLKTRLREALGKEPVLHAYTDEAMIGGLKLRIGDELIDASVATQLRKVRGDLRTGASDLRSRAGELYD